MKKYFLQFLLIFCCAYTQGQEIRIMESLSMHSRILNQEVKYSIVLPENYYKKTARYPVIYMLHGLGDDESSWLEYGQVGQISDNAVGKGEIVPMIYVMPQGFRSYYVNTYDGKFLYQDMFVKELIPFIDSVYRTRTGKNSRATLGYSMGGFGALVLPLKYSDLFTACVPLSISIRTDEQYKSEDSSGWNEQWGRLFGGINTSGEARITEYYKQNSPMHLLKDEQSDKWKNLRIYIDNGDDEQTLAFSNETIHQLMRDRNIRHEFRIRNGGHEFAYWRDALTNGLHFISDAFEGKPYRGDIELNTYNKKKATIGLLKPIKIGAQSYPVFFPSTFKETSRLYPVIYVQGDMSDADHSYFAEVAAGLIKNQMLSPFLMVFLPANETGLQDIIIPELEKNYRARKGFRFRSLMTVGNGASALKYALVPEQFTSCTLMDPSVAYDSLQQMVTAISAKAIERTWFFIGTNDKSPHYKTSGNLHLLFREKGIYHEYRVMEGTGNNAWRQQFLEEAFQFTLKKIHR